MRPYCPTCGAERSTAGYCECPRPPCPDCGTEIERDGTCYDCAERVAIQSEYETR